MLYKAVNRKTLIALAWLLLIVFSMPVFCSAEETFTLTLKAGENLIVLPCAPENKNIQEVLSSIIGKVKDVWEFDSADINDNWKHYQPGLEKYSDLKEMTANKGYWVNLKSGAALQIKGTRPIEDIVFDLKQGWNVVSWPYQDTQEISGTFNVLEFGVGYDQISKFNNFTKTQEDFLNQPESDDFTVFEPDQVYYIHMLEDVTITPGGGVLDITPPEIESVTPVHGSVFYEGESILISSAVVDTDPSLVEYRFSVDGIIVQDWSEQCELNWRAIRGKHNIEVKVRDVGGENIEEIEIYVFKRPLGPPD